MYENQNSHSFLIIPPEAIGPKESENLLSEDGLNWWNNL